PYSDTGIFFERKWTAHIKAPPATLAIISQPLWRKKEDRCAASVIGAASALAASMGLFDSKSEKWFKEERVGCRMSREVVHRAAAKAATLGISPGFSSRVRVLATKSIHPRCAPGRCRRGRTRRWEFRRATESRRRRNNRRRQA